MHSASYHNKRLFKIIRPLLDFIVWKKWFRDSGFSFEVKRKFLYMLIAGIVIRKHFINGLFLYIFLSSGGKGQQIDRSSFSSLNQKLVPKIYEFLRIFQKMHFLISLENCLFKFEGVVPEFLIIVGIMICEEYLLAADGWYFVGEILLMGRWIKLEDVGVGEDESEGVIILFF